MSVHLHTMCEDLRTKWMAEKRRAESAESSLSALKAENERLIQTFYDYRKSRPLREGERMVHLLDIDSENDKIGTGEDRARLSTATRDASLAHDPPAAALASPDPTEPR